MQKVPQAALQRRLIRLRLRVEPGPEARLSAPVVYSPTRAS